MESPWGAPAEALRAMPRVLWLTCITGADGKQADYYVPTYMVLAWLKVLEL